MTTLLKWFVTRILVLKYRINLLITILWRLFGFDYKAYQKKKRLGKAMRLADKLHIQHNGMRFFVIESNREGYYDVMNRQQIKANQKAGVFSSRASFLDFFQESPYYTKAETRSITKGKQVVDQTHFKNIIIYLVIVLIVLVTVIVILTK